jgi:hypothetical protein
MVIMACPPTSTTTAETRSIPGRPFYVIRAGDRAVVVGEENLIGSVQDLVTTILDAGKPPERRGKGSSRRRAPCRAWALPRHEGGSPQTGKTRCKLGWPAGPAAASTSERLMCALPPATLSDPLACKYPAGIPDVRISLTFRDQRWPRARCAGLLVPGPWRSVAEVGSQAVVV